MAPKAMKAMKVMKAMKATGAGKSKSAKSVAEEELLARGNGDMNSLKDWYNYGCQADPDMEAAEEVDDDDAELVEIPDEGITS